MFSASNYILPAMGLVCNLVSLQAPNNVTDSAVDQLPPQLQPELLPDGYVTYPNIVAYKFYNQSVTWMEAKVLCALQGAQLAVIEDSDKGKHFRGQAPSFDWMHAGVVRIDGVWTNINTGSPVESLPWASGEPSGDLDCTFLSASQGGLTNRACGSRKPYACELPLLINHNTIHPN